MQFPTVLTWFCGLLPNILFIKLYIDLEKASCGKVKVKECSFTELNSMIKIYYFAFTSDITLPARRNQVIVNHRIRVYTHIIIFRHGLA